jgi:N-acyl-D-amino-acid deacylase
MGVTTVVTGNCGGSWLSLSESFRSLEQNGISVNLASLIGHNTVRRAILKEDARDPSPEELEKMKQLVDQAMRDGAVGFATGLIYIPGTFAKTDEVIELAKVAAKHGGVYASHIRNEEAQVADAIKEAINVGEKAGLPVEISHFKISSKKLWGQTKMTVSLVREARERGLQVTVDQYAYTASSTGLEVLIPSWVHDGGREKAVERLRDPQTRQRIIKDMFDDIHGMGFKDWSYAVVANYRPDPSFNGKTIAQITEQVRRKKGAARPSRANHRDVSGERRPRPNGLPQDEREGR